jgi:flagellar hook assembly protein FlgD
LANILTTAETKKTPAGSRITIICDKDTNKPNTADVGILSVYKFISMLLYNGEGELVRKYFEFNSDLPEGQFAFEWSGTDENENPVPDGAYIFYLKLGSITMSRMVTK